jgi:3-methyladenine DNA glycosylase AlkD
MLNNADQQNAQTIVERLRASGNAANVAGMARYGISTKGTLGVPVKVLRGMAREIGKSHELAGELWASGIHEARILATIIEEPARVTGAQMNRWARDFDSWDVCDQACAVFRFAPGAFEKAAEWSGAKREFVRRAGFSLMAGLAVKAKSAPDAAFEAFLPLITAAAGDERNMVKKAVNWALRQIGKRNSRLRRLAIATAEEIRGQESKAAHWIAADALRELRRVE